MATISLGGTSLTPNGIDEDRAKIGSEIQAANGARRFAHRAIKREWTLTWSRITSTVRDQLRAVYALTATFTYIDENSNSITVFCPPGGFTCKVGAVTYESGATTLRYDVTLKIREA